jgi:hypothetical protein
MKVWSDFWYMVVTTLREISRKFLPKVEQNNSFFQLCFLFMLINLFIELAVLMKYMH